MKKKFSSEKIIYFSLFALFCVACITLAVAINSKVEKISSVPAVVIHDVSTTSIEERGKKAVYVTPSGSRYHLDGCCYLNENKITISKEEAIAAGYKSCSECQP